MKKTSFSNNKSHVSLSAGFLYKEKYGPKIREIVIFIKSLILLGPKTNICTRCSATHETFYLCFGKARVLIFKEM